MVRDPKVFLILFVVVHLLVDLAMPSLPGAFRFNPDESVVGVRVQSVQAHDLKPATQVDLVLWPFELPRLKGKPPVDSPRRINAPELIAFLPRRDPSPDRSLQGSTEDH